MPKIFQQAAFSADGTIPSFAKPATDLATFRPDWLVDAPQGAQWLMVWANYYRQNGDHNPPFINGRGFRYTSYTKANMATLAKLRSAYLSASAAKALCGAQGLRYVTWGDEAALANAPIVGGHYQNVAYCPPFIKHKAPGFVLDYECGDGRSTAVTSAFFKRVAGELYYIPRILYTNQVGAPGYRSSGLLGIELETASRFHGVSIFQDKDERLLAKQLAAFGKRKWKAIVTVDLKSNDVLSVLYARNFVLNNGLSAAHLWRNGVDLGAASTTQKLALFETWGTQ